MRIRILHIILLVMALVQLSNAQNIHYAQYYDHTTLFNAASAASIQERGSQVGLIYRDQAFAATDHSFRTFGASAIIGLLSDAGYNKVGLSLNVLHDRAGTGSLVANQAYLGLAYQVGMTRNQRISLGGQVGFVQRSVGNFNSLIFEEDILGSGVTEFTDIGSNQYLDYNAGFQYKLLTDNDHEFNLGFSFQNMNRGTDVSGTIEKYNHRVVGFSSFLYSINRQLEITPRVLYQRTFDKASEIVVQTELSYATSRYGDTRIFGATGWRFFDAIQVIVGMEGSNWKSGLAYEINTSSQRKATNLSSALELSFIYKQQRRKKKKKKEEAPIILPPAPLLIILSSNIEGVEELDQIEYLLRTDKDTLSARSFSWPNLDSLESNTNYTIIVSKENYSSDSLSFNTFDIKSDTTIYKLLKMRRMTATIDSSILTIIDSSTITNIIDSTQIVTSPPTKIIYKEVPIILERIFYDFDDAGILPESEKELTDLYNILIQFPEIKIELSSHTDIHGSHAYNNRLSQSRANAATRWLIERGIASNRIVSKGYGETRLINHCAEGTPCSEELHRQNRRTEFKIIEGPEFIRVPVTDF